MNVAAYLTAGEFEFYSLVPSTYTAAVEAKFPGWLDKQLEIASSDIDARLSVSRYAVPFEDPAPEVVKAWVAAIVSPDLCIKRGIDQLDEQYLEFTRRATVAHNSIDDAAALAGGRYNLPLRADNTESAVSKGGTRIYSEQSPYVFMSMHRDAGRADDERRTGRRR